MYIQGLIEDYQLLVLQEGKSDMFQNVHFSTIFYVHFRNSREGKSASRGGESLCSPPSNIYIYIYENLNYRENHPRAKTAGACSSAPKVCSRQSQQGGQP